MSRLLPPQDHRVLPLTAKQDRILRYIQAVTENQGEPPSARCIARQFEVDMGTVRDHLLALYRKGWLITPSPAGLRCAHLSQKPEVLSHQSEPTPSK